MLFSATMPQQIRLLATRFMHNPEDIRVRGTRITEEEIRQIVVETTDRAKQATLRSMIDVEVKEDQDPIKKGIKPQMKNM
jgi:ATP-dependent RNA helicase DeaD